MQSNLAGSDIALVCDGVSARFADERAALALTDITLSIPTGSFVSFTGPSGAGKTTLMRVILGLMRPAGGRIVRNFSQSAMVFQNYALFPWATALQNVAYGLKMAGAPRALCAAHAREKLAEVGLAGLEARYPAELSGGQRQRVGLARALAVDPDLLVLDEPFSNLDTITAEALKADLLKLWRQYGMTILMVNHLIPDTVELSDQAIVMHGGPGRIAKVVDIGLSRPRNPRGDPFYRAVDQLTEEIRKVSG